MKKLSKAQAKVLRKAVCNSKGQISGGVVQTNTLQSLTDQGLLKLDVPARFTLDGRPAFSITYAGHKALEAYDES